MENARCPGCHATVRHGSDWCSLCYADLRPSPLTAAAPRHRSAAASGIALAEDLAPAGGLRDRAAPPPGVETVHAVARLRPAHHAADDILDAEILDAGNVDEPRTGTSEEPAPRWPCACGGGVPIHLTACPSCGSAFLGDLRDVGSGRHRPGSRRGWLPRSRRIRMALAGTIAVLVAIVLPALLALLG